ncbi:hypothetical protein [Bacillus sp. X1(2014)]|uniref:hypothetical protein n=1 Tax=Bacillus sp. X1(2014) TaxID=1565991 RepID=UPI0011A00A09|nr:hypothetical protein [Bacillus sp. X1(2014)]
MWFWIIISVLLFVLLLVVEEFFYYFWNRYVYGPNIKGKRRWLSKLVLGTVGLIKRLFQKREKVLSKTKSDKGLPL